MIYFAGKSFFLSNIYRQILNGLRGSLQVGLGNSGSCLFSALVPKQQTKRQPKRQTKRQPKRQPVPLLSSGAHSQ